MKSFDLSGSGSPLHFLHANGYPPNCYDPLFEILKAEYHVLGMTLRPLWGNEIPEEIRDWHPFSVDLIRFLSDGESDTVIGVGHSIGATVTLRAALRNPGKFSALVLIEPVIFVPYIMRMWHIVRAVGVGDRVHPLVVGAKKRRRSFDDLETVFSGYRNRNVFRYMTDESLRAYIQGITKPKADGKGFDLVFPPEWEVQIYRTSMHDLDIWRGLPQLEVPTLIIRGVETDTFLEVAAKLVKRKQPKVRIEAVEKSTHLLPLERPKEVFEIMRSFLKEVQ